MPYFVKLVGVGEYDRDKKRKQFTQWFEFVDKDEYESFKPFDQIAKRFARFLPQGWTLKEGTLTNTENTTNRPKGDSIIKSKDI